MNCDQIRELLEAYVLEVLDSDERVRVERHLAGCPDCQRLVSEYVGVVHVLPEALAAVSSLRPPASLKTRVLQMVESTSARTLEAAEQKPGEAHQVWRESGDNSADSESVGIWRSISGWSQPQLRRLRTVGALAAVVLLALSLLWSVRLSVALARERALRAEFAGLVSQQELVLEVVDSDKTARQVLRAVDDTSRAYGKLFTRSDMPYVVVMAARLALPPSGQAYHLWLTDEDQTRLAGVMAVNAEGFGLLIFEADEDGPMYEEAQLTLQPIGSVTPSGIPVLLWKATAER